MKTVKVTLNIGLKNNPLSFGDVTDLDGFEAERIALMLSSVFGPRRFNFDFEVGQWDGEDEPTAIVQFEYPYQGDGLDAWYMERLAGRVADMLTQECVPIVVEHGGESYGALAYSRAAKDTIEPSDMCIFNTAYFHDFVNVLESFNIEKS